MADNQRQQAEKKKKETIIDLTKYLDKKIRVKFSGGREASGILKGNTSISFSPLAFLLFGDSFLNLFMCVKDSIRS